MAIFTPNPINLGSVTIAQLVNAFCKVYGYQATINGQPNPLSKAQFAQRQLNQYIKDIYKQSQNMEYDEARNIPDPDFN